MQRTDFISGRHLVAVLSALAVLVTAFITVGSSVAEAQEARPIRPDSCEATVDDAGGFATITWVAAAEDNAARYLLYRFEDGERQRWSGSTAADDPAPFTWALTDGVDYEFAVKTRGVDGTFTALRLCTGPGEPEPMPSPTRPLSCIATIFGDTATITWTPTADDAAYRYALYRYEDGGGQLWSGAVFADDPLVKNWTLDAGVDYEFGVKTHGLDDSYTAATRCTTESPPVIPAPVQCSSDAKGPVVTVAWEAVPQAAAHVVYLYDYDDLVELAVVEAPTASIRFEEPGGTTMAVSSRWTNASGEVETSDPLFCSDQPGGLLPVDPVTCSVAIVDGVATVSWTATDGDAADRYLIYRRADGASSLLWTGSVPPTGSSYSTSSVSSPEENGWLVKTRSTMADGVRRFSSGTPCSGTDVEFVLGDSIVKPGVLTGMNLSVSGSTVNATLEAGEPESGDFQCRAVFDVDGDPYLATMQGSVWYAWTPETTGTYTLTMDSPGWSGAVALYQTPDGLAPEVPGDLADALVGCHHVQGVVPYSTPTAVDVVAGELYYFQVSGEFFYPYRQPAVPGTGGFTFTLAP